MTWKPSAPKFRAQCVTCGERQPRATTNWTAAQWMSRHERDVDHTPAPTTTEVAAAGRESDG